MAYTDGLKRATRVAKEQIRGVRPFTVVGSRYNIPIFDNSFIWIGPDNIDFTFTDSLIDRISIISSDSSLDVDIPIFIIGLDENWLEVTQTILLNGQNKVALTTELIRINSAVALQNLTGNCYIYEDGSISNGEPDDLTTVKGYITPDNNRMFSTAFTTAIDKQISILGLKVIGRPSTGCCIQVKPFFYPFNGAKTAFAFYPIVNQSSSYLNLVPESTQIINPQVDLFFEVNASTPNGGVTVITEFEVYPSS